MLYAMNSTLTKRIISADSKRRIVDSSGRILYFPTDQFISDICMKDNCFICGRSEKVVPFNREHVLPDWIIRKYNLNDRHITLINGSDIKYSSYRVPCCIECNRIRFYGNKTTYGRSKSNPDVVA